MFQKGKKKWNLTNLIQKKKIRKDENKSKKIGRGGGGKGGA